MLIARLWNGDVASEGGSLRTPAFVSLCAMMGLAYLHQGITLVMVPLYVVAIGHSETAAGALVAAFSIASVLVRPAWGHMADRSTARTVVLAGTVLCAAAALLHLPPVLWVLALAGVLRGVGWGAVNTGGNTALVGSTPPERRGLASSIYNIFQNTGMAIAPAMGLLVLEATDGSFTLVFVLSALLMVAASFTVTPIGTRRDRTPPRPVADGTGHVRAASRPAVLVGVFMLTQPAMIIFVPLFGVSIGIPSASMTWYYVALGVFGVLVRVAFGSVSDRIGRGQAIVLGFAIAVLSTAGMAFATTLPFVILAGLCYTIGQALVVPATTALAIDRVPTGGAGRVMGLFTGAFQVGMGVGSLVVAALAEHLGYRSMFHIVAGSVGLVVLYLLVEGRRGDQEMPA